MILMCYLLALQFSIRPGDVIIAATDGLWDNLWDDDVASIVSSAFPADDEDVGNRSQAAVQRLARRITQAAQAAAKDATAR